MSTKLHPTVCRFNRIAIPKLNARFWAEKPDMARSAVGRKKFAGSMRAFQRAAAELSLIKSAWLNWRPTCVSQGCAAASAHAQKP